MRSFILGHERQLIDDEVISCRRYIIHLTSVIKNSAKHDHTKVYVWFTDDIRPSRIMDIAIGSLASHDHTYRKMEGEITALFINRTMV